MYKYLILLVVAFNSFANLELAPPSFKYKDSKAVYIDITEGTYDIKSYPSKLTTKAKTTWIFKIEEEGYPIMDFVPKRMFVRVNGQKVRFSQVDSPDKVTSYKVINKKLQPGTHKLEIWTRVKRGTNYGYRSVNSGFFIKDLTQKKFLEKYVPANLEFDQYPMTFNVRVYSSKKHKIMANGVVKKKSWNNFTVKYPAYYSSSSIYFHLFKVGKYRWNTSSIESIDGRIIPIRVYTKSFLKPSKFVARAKKVFKELEADYGAWPHPELLIYGMHVKGGMEYPGATATSLRSLGHEMFHSYFAKGVIPADGNSGWMDEGLASWRDRGYQTLDHPGYDLFNLGAHSVYKRNTDKNSYKVGRAFFGYLNSKFDLKTTLKGYFAKHKHSLVTTDMMIEYFEASSGMSLKGDFVQYVLNTNYVPERANYVESFGMMDMEDNHHPELSEEEMQAIL